MKHPKPVLTIRGGLRNARMRAGLSQSEVARLAGTRPNSVARAENGAFASPALILKVASALATYSTVVGRDDDDLASTFAFDDRIKAAERRLAAIELQLSRAGVELAYQRALVGVVD